MPRSGLTDARLPHAENTGMNRRKFLGVAAAITTGTLLSKGIAATFQQRLIAFDVATTGLDPRAGHRIFEVAAVEFIDRRITGRSFHSRFDPERELCPPAAFIYELTQEKLVGAPKFGELLNTLMEFLNYCPLVIHNAPFDLAFLDSELKRLGRISESRNSFQAIDTLSLARTAGLKQCTLPNLCEHFGMAFDERSPYDCLSAARAVAGIYLALTAGAEMNA